MRKMLACALSCILVAGFWLATAGQTGTQVKVFIAPMQGGFESYLTTEMLKKKKLPFVITADENEADYIITGVSGQGTNHWYDTVFGVERDRNVASIRMIRVENRQVVWAGESGDRNIWFGAGLFGDSGGPRTVAQRIAKRMEKDFDGKKYALSPSSPEFKAARKKPTPEVTTASVAVQSPPTSVSPSVQTTSDEKVKFTLESNPSGATITIDGIEVGQTPKTITLTRRKHAVTLSLAGYQTWARDVEVIEGTLNLRLDRVQ